MPTKELHLLPPNALSRAAASRKIMFLEIYLDMTKKIVTDFYAIFQRLLISANTQAAKFRNSNIKKTKYNIKCQYPIF